MMDIRKLLRLGNKELQPSEVAEVLQRLDDLPRARQHHYIFAHKLFPALVRHMGATPLLILGNPNRAGEFLETMWLDVGADIPPDDRIAEPPRPARVVPSQASPRTLIALVAMPEARAVTEAHFVALVCSDLPGLPDEDDPDGLREFEQRLNEAPVRYLTLEYGFSLDGSRRTAFCEWDAEGRHLNRGDGPEPTAEAFWNFLEGHFDTPALGSFTPPSEPG